MSTPGSSLVLKVEWSITSEEVARTLAALLAKRGKPAFICSDNGPRFIAKAVKRWLEVSEVMVLTRLHGPIRVKRSGSVKGVEEDGQERQTLLA
jgi:hypothetical protein